MAAASGDGTSMNNVALPERAAAAWTRWYTRGLPTEMADGRRAELASDLHEHRAEARDTGVSERRTSVEIAARLVEGIPADLSWRRAQRSRARSMTMATDSSTRGYPISLTIVLWVMGSLALFMSLSSFVGALIDGDNGMAVWGLLLLLVGTGIVAGLLLVDRAPYASVALAAVGAIGFGLATFWMVVTVAVGVVVAAAVLFCIPRVAGPRLAT